MNGKHIIACIGWLCLSFVFPVHAKCSPLYGSETWSKAGAEGLKEASGRALSQVLMKLSGNPNFIEGLSKNDSDYHPDTWVQRYRNVASPNPDDSRQWIWMQFDHESLNNFLKKKKIVPWTTPRPKTLVWFVLDHDGKQQIIARDSSKAFSTQMAHLLSTRGLAFIYPFLDKHDQTFVQSGNLWRLDASAIRQASERYKVEQISVVKVVYQPYDSQWHADVMQLSSAGAKRTEASDTMLTHLLVKIADQLLIQTYASVSQIDLVQEETEGVVQLTHVASAQDYRQVIDWIKKRNQVKAVTLLAITPDTMTLKLKLLGGASHFFRQLMAIPKLRYQNHTNSLGKSRVWQFSWQQNNHKRNEYA